MDASYFNTFIKNHGDTNRVMYTNNILFSLKVLTNINYNVKNLDGSYFILFVPYKYVTNYNCNLCVNGIKLNFDYDASSISG